VLPDIRTVKLEPYARFTAPMISASSGIVKSRRYMNISVNLSVAGTCNDNEQSRLVELPVLDLVSVGR
jgi:hypothetical protein